MRAYLPEELFTKVPLNDTLTKVFQFPIVRLIIKLLIMVVSINLIAGLLSYIFYNYGIDIHDQNSPFQIIAALAQVFAALAALHLYTHFVEKRPLIEMNYSVGFKEFFVGFFIGAILISLVVACLYISGALQFTAYNGIHNIFNFFGAWIIAAFIEEFVFRGIIFKLTEEGFGTWIALLVQALLFGFVHYGNPNASMLSTLAISLEAGILLAAIYLLTRRLWMAIGLHFSWNFIQGSVYDIQVSGHDVQGIFESSVSGSTLISGGEFGAEASIFAIVICTVTGIFCLIKALKMPNNIVKPIWLRNKIKNETI